MLAAGPGQRCSPIRRKGCSRHPMNPIRATIAPILMPPLQLGVQSLVADRSNGRLECRWVSCQLSARCADAEIVDK